MASNKNTSNTSNTSNKTNTKGKASKASKGNVSVPATGTATTNNASVAVGTPVARKLSNKQLVFASWQAMVVANGGVAPKPATIAQTLHTKHNLQGQVALQTLAGWLSSWAAGKNLPSGQPKNVIPAFIKGTYRTVATTPVATTK